jgi:hypothetical protein
MATPLPPLRITRPIQRHRPPIDKLVPVDHPTWVLFEKIQPDGKQLFVRFEVPFWGLTNEPSAYAMVLSQGRLFTVEQFEYQGFTYVCMADREPHPDDTTIITGE